MILRLKQIVGRKDLAWSGPDCLGEVRNYRTFYGNWRGSRAVQGFKLRWTSLYIEVIIYRLVTSLVCSSRKCQHPSRCCITTQVFSTNRLSSPFPLHATGLLYYYYDLWRFCISPLTCLSKQASESIMPRFQFARRPSSNSASRPQSNPSNPSIRKNR